MDGTFNPIDKQLGARILSLKNRVVAGFSRDNWLEFGLLSGHTDLIQNHSRLLRSLDFGDDDYSGHVQDILIRLGRQDTAHLDTLEQILDQHYPESTPSTYVSSQPSARKLTFAPTVFTIPDKVTVETGLVAVMMPFAAEFTNVHTAIQNACDDAGFTSVRGDNIWDHSTIIQDVFALILRAQIVVVDFTGKNGNVMYETGIAHTLGKIVIPISQSQDHVPFDLKHHRVLRYVDNLQGLAELSKALAAKLRSLKSPSHVPPWA